MKLRETRHDGIDVFHLEGEIDLHYAPALRALLEAKAKARCPALIVDLSEVTSIDSTGIAVLLEYLRESTGFGGQFCIAGLTRPVRYVFDMMRLEKAVRIFNSLGEALAALGSGRMAPPAEPLFGSPETGTSQAAA